MDNKLITGIIGVVVVVALLGSALVPVIDSIAGGVEYEDNPDWDGWVRFDLNTSAGAEYHLGMSQDENGIYVENIFSDSRDMQIYDDSTTVEYPTIMYADSNTVIWSIDDTFSVMGKVNGSPFYLSGTILDVTKSADGVEVVTADDSAVFDAPTWAYVPFSQGKYGFYPYDEDRGVEHPANAPTAVLGGGNVGVWAYNEIYRYDGLGLVMNPIVEDGLYYGATWEKPAESVEIQSLNPDDLDPAVIDLNPIDLDPITLDPGMQLMAVPTPTYTDGVWGYDLTTIGGATKALIVSYSGSGGDIVVPATVGGYDVHRFGKAATNSSSGYNVFDNSTLSSNSTITFTDGIIEFGANALENATNITGSLVIPSSVTAIGMRAFAGCTGFTGSLVIPSSVTAINARAFQNCTGFTGSLVIPSSVTSIGQNAFYNIQCTDVIILSNATPGSNALYSTTIANVLDFSDTVDYSVDRYGIPDTATVYDSIGDCFGFISIVTTEHGSSGALGGAAALLYAIPVVIIAAMLVAGVGWFIGKRY